MLATTLPDLNALDREALQALLVAEHEERIATQERLRSRESEIEHLKLLIAKLRRMQFGRRSEKVQRQIEQLELRLEDLEAKQAERQANSAPPTTSNRLLKKLSLHWNPVRAWLRGRVRSVNPLPAASVSQPSGHTSAPSYAG